MTAMKPVVRKFKFDDWTLVVKVDGTESLIKITSSYKGGDSISVQGTGLSAWGMLYIVESMNGLNGNRLEITTTAFQAIRDASVWGSEDKFFSAKMEHMKTKPLHGF